MNKMSFPILLLMPPPSQTRFVAWSLELPAECLSKETQAAQGSALLPCEKCCAGTCWAEARASLSAACSQAAQWHLSQATRGHPQPGALCRDQPGAQEPK